MVQVSDKKVQFGNLAKLVPLTIISVAVAVALVIALVNGMDYQALLNASLVLATGTVSAGVGAVTAAVGKSQTRLDLEAAQGAVSDEQVVEPVQVEQSAGPVDYTSPEYASGGSVPV